MAATMIDRLVHHGHLIIFEGENCRMKHTLMQQTQRLPAKRRDLAAVSMVDDLNREIPMITNGIVDDF